MKKTNFLTFFAIVLMCFLTLGMAACGNDDDPNEYVLNIFLEEANIEGDELCVEADIMAESRTASIVIEILDATETNVKVTYPVTASKYIGVRNIDGFHVHVPIAGKEVKEGDLLILTVTDAKGQSLSVNKTITEEEDEDEEHDHD